MHLKLLISGMLIQYDPLIINTFSTFNIVDAQFPTDDVARLLNCLHNRKDNRIEERLGVSWWGHSDA